MDNRYLTTFYHAMEEIIDCFQMIETRYPCSEYYLSESAPIIPTDEFSKYIDCLRSQQAYIRLLNWKKSNLLPDNEYTRRVSLITFDEFLQKLRTTVSTYFRRQCRDHPEKKTSNIFTTHILW